MAPRLVIFDCDGTLVDSQHMIVEAMGRAFERHGLRRLQRERVLSIVGLSLPLAIQRLLPAESADLVATVSDAYKQAFGDLRRQPEHQEPLYPGAADALDALLAAPDVVLGIATGKSRRGVDGVLERYDLGGHFVTIQTADDNPSKPHPEMIRRAMAEAGVEAERTVMVGDTTFDMDMAQAAGTGALGVAWGYHPVADLAASGAHAIVTGYEQLGGALDDIFRQLETEGRR
jgi:phosphoglycolate phosphatase